ncbi:MAG: hypothetical protein AAGC46_16400, partial [Solirubrobacteraceae bacterium]|nr:hypothetical protein [Patulibacter sp.]
VTVTIHSVRDAAGLQAKLVAAGIPAVVDYVPDGKACAPGRFTPASGGLSTASFHMGAPGSEGVTDGPATFTFRKDEFKPGQTLVLTNSLGANVSATTQAVAAGTVKPCEPVDAPSIADTAPPAHGGSSSGAASERTRPDLSGAAVVEGGLSTGGSVGGDTTAGGEPTLETHLGTTP